MIHGPRETAVVILESLQENAFFHEVSSRGRCGASSGEPLSRINEPRPATSVHPARQCLLQALGLVRESLDSNPWLDQPETSSVPLNFWGVSKSGSQVSWASFQASFSSASRTFFDLVPNSTQKRV